MLLGALIAATWIAVARCVWVRRITWHVKWEESQTLSITLQCIGLLLVAPFQSSLLGSLLHSLTDVWHLDAYLGHVCYLAAVACVVNAVACRVTDDETRLKLIRCMQVPGVIAIQIMLTALIASRAPFSADFFRAPINNWLAVYWLTYWGMMIYVLGLAVWLLMILGADPRSRRAARAFLAGCGCGIGSAMAWIVVVLTDDWHTSGEILMWVLGCAASLFFGIGAARSWQTKAAGAPPLLRDA